MLMIEHLTASGDDDDGTAIEMEEGDNLRPVMMKVVGCLEVVRVVG